MNDVRLFAARFAPRGQGTQPRTFSLRYRPNEDEPFAVIDSLGEVESRLLGRGDFASGLSAFMNCFRAETAFFAASGQYLELGPDNRFEEALFSLLLPKPVDALPFKVELYRRWDGGRPGRYVLYTSVYSQVTGTFTRQDGSVIDDFQTAVKSYVSRCSYKVSWYSRSDFNTRILSEIGTVCNECGETLGKLDRKSFTCLRGHVTALGG
jgi:hypothetical protein